MPSATTNRSDGAVPGAYQGRLDPEIRAFVARTAEWYPPETLALPIARQRQIYDAMCRAFHCGRPDGVGCDDGTIDLADRRLPVRRYRLAGAEPVATVLYYHGGGFVLGDLDSHDDVCAGLCGGTGYDVISVAYRLAPEHPHPAAFEDACAAFDWAMAGVERPLLLCGESAGGTLAAAVAQARRGHARAAIGQLLIYPDLGSDLQGPSCRAHAEAPMLTLGDVEAYRLLRLGGAAGTPDPRAAPLRDRDFAGLPPTVIVTAECDPLSSEGEAYRDRIRSAGGRAHWHEAAGLVHSFLRARRSSRRARQAFSLIVSAAAALGAGAWPYDQ
jgi:acetyl esterase